MGKNLNVKKTAVIIGATGHLGNAVCKLLQSKGYYLSPKWLGKDHPDCKLEKSYVDLPKRIDLAVYLAGINIVQATETMSLRQWNNVMAVNLNGAFLFAKAAFPSLKRADGATFITISSIMVTHPYPYRLAYTVSKAGLEAMTKELAVEWGKHKIYTHCIRLGHLSTLMKSTKTNPELLIAVRAKTPTKHLINCSEVANYILWLAEGGSVSVSGTTINFDPAYTINRWPL